MEDKKEEATLEVPCFYQNEESLYSVILANDGSFSGEIQNEDAYVTLLNAIYFGESKK